MFPPWVELILNGLPCPHCRRPLAADTVIAVGVIFPRHLAPVDIRPQALILAGCPGCGRILEINSYQELPEILAAVEVQYRRLAAAAASAPIQSPFRQTDEDRHHHEDRGVNPLRAPPTEAEIRGFLNLLHRTSFKRTSISFRRWLTRLLKGR